MEPPAKPGNSGGGDPYVPRAASAPDPTPPQPPYPTSTLAPTLAAAASGQFSSAPTYRRHASDPNFDPTTTNTKPPPSYNMPTTFSAYEPRQARTRATMGYSSPVPIHIQTSVGYTSAMLSQNQTSVGYSLAMPLQNQTSVGYSSAMPPQNQTSVGYSSAMLLQNQTSVGYSSAMPLQNQTSVGYSLAMAPQNQTSVGYTSSMSPQNQTSVGYSSAMPPVNQTSVGYTSSMPPQNQTSVGYSSALLPQNQTSGGYTSASMLHQNQTSVGYYSSSSMPPHVPRPSSNMRPPPPSTIHPPSMSLPNSPYPPPPQSITSSSHYAPPPPPSMISASPFPSSNNSASTLHSSSIPRSAHGRQNTISASSSSTGLTTRKALTPQPRPASCLPGFEYFLRPASREAHSSPGAQTTSDLRQRSPVTSRSAAAAMTGSASGLQTTSDLRQRSPVTSRSAMTGSASGAQTASDLRQRSPVRSRSADVKQRGYVERSPGRRVHESTGSFHQPNSPNFNSTSSPSSSALQQSMSPVRNPNITTPTKKQAQLMSPPKQAIIGSPGKQSRIVSPGRRASAITPTKQGVRPQGASASVPSSPQQPQFTSPSKQTASQLIQQKLAQQYAQQRSPSSQQYPQITSSPQQQYARLNKESNTVSPAKLNTSNDTANLNSNITLAQTQKLQSPSRQAIAVSSSPDQSPNTTPSKRNYFYNPTPADIVTFLPQTYVPQSPPGQKTPRDCNITSPGPGGDARVPRPSTPRALRPSPRRDINEGFGSPGGASAFARPAHANAGEARASRPFTPTGLGGGGRATARPSTPTADRAPTRPSPRDMNETDRAPTRLSPYRGDMNDGFGSPRNAPTLHRPSSADTPTLRGQHQINAMGHAIPGSYSKSQVYSPANTLASPQPVPCPVPVTAPHSYPPTQTTTPTATSGSGPNGQGVDSKQPWQGVKSEAPFCSNEFLACDDNLDEEMFFTKPKLPLPMKREVPYFSPATSFSYKPKTTSLLRCPVRKTTVGGRPQFSLLPARGVVPGAGSYAPGSSCGHAAVRQSLLHPTMHLPVTVSHALPQPPVFRPVGLLMKKTTSSTASTPQTETVMVGRPFTPRQSLVYCCTPPVTSAAYAAGGSARPPSSQAHVMSRGDVIRVTSHGDLYHMTPPQHDPGRQTPHHDLGYLHPNTNVLSDVRGDVRVGSFMGPHGDCMPTGGQQSNFCNGLQRQDNRYYPRSDFNAGSSFSFPHCSGRQTSSYSSSEMGALGDHSMLCKTLLFSHKTPCGDGDAGLACRHESGMLMPTATRSTHEGFPCPAFDSSLVYGFMRLPDECVSNNASVVTLRAPETSVFMTHQAGVTAQTERGFSLHDAKMQLTVNQHHQPESFHQPPPPSLPPPTPARYEDEHRGLDMLSDVSLLIESINKSDAGSKTSGVDQLLHASDTLTSLADADLLLQAPRTRYARSDLPPPAYQQSKRDFADVTPLSAEHSHAAQPPFKSRRTASRPSPDSAVTFKVPKSRDVSATGKATRGRPRKVVEAVNVTAAKDTVDSTPKRGRPKKEKTVIQGPTGVSRETDGQFQPRLLSSTRQRNSATATVFGEPSVSKDFFYGYSDEYVARDDVDTRYTQQNYLSYFSPSKGYTATGTAHQNLFTQPNYFGYSYASNPYYTERETRQTQPENFAVSNLQAAEDGSCSTAFPFPDFTGVFCDPQDFGGPTVCDNPDLIMTTNFSDKDAHTKTDEVKANRTDRDDVTNGCFRKADIFNAISTNDDVFCAGRESDVTTAVGSGDVSNMLNSGDVNNVVNSGDVGNAGDVTQVFASSSAAYAVPEFDPLVIAEEEVTSTMQTIGVEEEKEVGGLQEKPVELWNDLGSIKVTRKVSRFFVSSSSSDDITASSRGSKKKKQKPKQTPKPRKAELAKAEIGKGAKPSGRKGIKHRHFSGNFPCDVCTRRYASKSNLLRHQRLFHPSLFQQGVAEKALLAPSSDVGSKQARSASRMTSVAGTASNMTSVAGGASTLTSVMTLPTLPLSPSSMSSTISSDVQSPPWSAPLFLAPSYTNPHPSNAYTPNPDSKKNDEAFTKSSSRVHVQQASANVDNVYQLSDVRAVVKKNDAGTFSKRVHVQPAPLNVESAYPFSDVRAVKKNDQTCSKESSRVHVQQALLNVDSAYQFSDVRTLRHMQYSTEICEVIDVDGVQQSNDFRPPQPFSSTAVCEPSNVDNVLQLNDSRPPQPFNSSGVCEPINVNQKLNNSRPAHPFNSTGICESSDNGQNLNDLRPPQPYSPELWKTSNVDNVLQLNDLRPQQPTSTAGVCMDSELSNIENARQLNDMKPRHPLNRSGVCEASNVDSIHNLNDMRPLQPMSAAGVCMDSEPSNMRPRHPFNSSGVCEASNVDSMNDLRPLQPMSTAGVCMDSEPSNMRPRHPFNSSGVCEASNVDSIHNLNDMRPLQPMSAVEVSVDSSEVGHSPPPTLRPELLKLIQSAHARVQAWKAEQENTLKNTVNEKDGAVTQNDAVVVVEDTIDNMVNKKDGAVTQNDAVVVVEDSLDSMNKNDCAVIEDDAVVVVDSLPEEDVTPCTIQTDRMSTRSRVAKRVASKVIVPQDIVIASQDTLSTKFGASRGSLDKTFGASQDTLDTKFGACQDTTDTKFGASRDTTDTKFGASKETLNTQFGASRDSLVMKFAALHGISATPGRSDKNRRLTRALENSKLTERNGGICAENTLSCHAESSLSRLSRNLIAEESSKLSDRNGGGVCDESSFSCHDDSLLYGHIESTLPDHEESSVLCHAESSLPNHAECSLLRHAESTSSTHARSTPRHAKNTRPSHAKSTPSRAENTPSRHAKTTPSRHSKTTPSSHAITTPSTYTETLIPCRPVFEDFMLTRARAPEDSAPRRLQFKVKTLGESELYMAQYDDEIIDVSDDDDADDAFTIVRNETDSEFDNDSWEPTPSKKRKKTTPVLKPELKKAEKRESSETTTKKRRESNEAGTKKKKRDETLKPKDDSTAKPHAGDSTPKRRNRSKTPRPKESTELSDEPSDKPKRRHRKKKVYTEEEENSTLREHSPAFHEDRPTLSFRTKQRTRINSTIPCPYCNKMFSVMSNLKRHTRDQHHDVYVFTCNVCRHKFSNRRTLRKHNKLSHNTKYPNECRDCLAVFCTERELQQHRASHSIQRYPCPDCHLVFYTEQHLHDHIAEYHVRNHDQ